MDNHTTAFLAAYCKVSALIDESADKAQAEIDKRCQFARRSIAQRVRYMMPKPRLVPIAVEGGTFSATNLPAWLTIDENTGRLSGMPPVVCRMTVS